MPLVAPLLRTLFTFLNVFETFKVLKNPPCSGRNGDQPTVRALSQRKRAMKGCMTVWLVWCCFILYERTVDNFVGLFIPFYHELKSLLIIFFILTRSRSTEPIFLHVLRPLIKPYVATLDACLHVITFVGEILFLLVSIPIEFCVSRYRRWFKRSKKPSEHAAEETKAPAAESQDKVPAQKPGPRRLDSTEHGAVRSRKHALEDAHVKARTTIASRVPRAKALPSVKVTFREETSEIWHPSRAAYEQEGLPTPPYDNADPIAIAQRAELQADLDWRKYEPFPSAYPPTPSAPRAGLPNADAEPMEGIQEQEEPGLTEGQRKYPVTPIPRRRKSGPGASTNNKPVSSSEEEADEDERNPFQRAGFRKSLKPTHESLNPKHAGDWSDDKEDTDGVQQLGEISSEGEGKMDVDEYDEDIAMEEDSFDMTFRTPFPLSKRKNLSQFSAASTEDTSDILSGLDTVDNGSPLRTRVNSELPATTSLAGMKRPHTGIDGEDLAARVRRLENMRTTAKTRQAPASRTRSPRQRPPRLHAESSSASNTVSEKEVETEDKSSSSSATKKRRLGLDKEALPIAPGPSREYRKADQTTSKPTITGTRVRRATGLSQAQVPSNGSATGGEPSKTAPLKSALRKAADIPPAKPVRTQQATLSKTGRQIRNDSMQ